MSSTVLPNTVHPLVGKIANFEKWVKKADKAGDLADKLGEKLGTGPITPSIARQIIDITLTVFKPQNVYENLIHGDLEDMADEKVMELARVVTQQREVLDAWNQKHAIDRERKQLQFDLRGLQTQIGAKQTEKGDCQQWIDRFTQEISHLDKKILQAEGILRRANLPALQQHERKLRAGRDELMGELNTLTRIQEGHLSHTRARLREMIKGINNQLHKGMTTMGDYHRVERERTRFQQERDQNAQAKAQLESKCKYLSSEIDTLRRDITNTQNRLNSL